MTEGRAVGLTGSCIDTLTRWEGPSHEQERLRQQYLQHLAQRPDGWSRNVLPHLTASSLVCAVAEARVLLTLHAKLGRWLQTGGHIDADDGSLEAAALRESQEESGLDELELDPSPLLLSRHALSCAGRPTFHLDVQFLVLSAETLTPRVSTESLDVRWFAVDALPEVDQTVRDLVDTAAARLGWPSPHSA